MVTRKYLGDYRLENRTNPRNGKVVTVPVYRGEWFAFTADAQTVRKMKRLYPLLSALSAAMFLLVMLLNAPCGHMFYVMLPFAAMIFPVYFALAGSRRLLTAKEKVTREHNDKIRQRFTSCALFMTTFSAISAAGHAVYAFRAALTGRDIVSFAATLVVLVCAAVMFAKRDALEMKKTA